MKKLLKKNQMIVTVLALLIAVAGYIGFTNDKIGDDKIAKEATAQVEDTYDYEISAEDGIEEDIFADGDDFASVSEAVSVAGTEVMALSTEVMAEQDSTELIESPGEAVMASSVIEDSTFAAEMKLNREQVRGKNKEALLNIVNNENIDEASKQEAVSQMIEMTGIAEQEAAAEMLLEAKGFTDVVVSITDDSADVVLNMGEVTDAKRAQIEDIVKRKTNIAADKIVITPIASESN